ncbi:hypothetical protein ETD86_08590 [Nonomuraea turkmeniaca]|uniref:Uncharacterized protein n=1 Tax=Nonomuraea turkmeniaca TaxID=103838 RepID=A0A5S4FRI4_9ACTN|nr:hypothetical protein [Nonomuraea turkmeniaca]TMR23345.1 hypothetical protein ETD86_08590 [Nonomuraea turkmeniaca]
MLGALALAGGVAGLLGVNGTFSGAPAASRSTAQPGASGPQVRAEEERSTAVPGRAGAASPRASTQAKAHEVQQAAPKETKKPVPEQTAAPDTVEGSAPEQETPEEAVLLVPGMDDTDGYRADGPSAHTDRQAAEYFRTRWGSEDKALKRIKDIRTIGGYLRIYTDLPATAHNSGHAITLCKRGLAYLKAARVARPVVFVQARFGENGNPVLANILGPWDKSCSVTHPAPD